jgi:hypothetical protein
MHRNHEVDMTNPAPYPSDTKAKGWRFELDNERIRQSDTWALAAPEIRPWLLMLWMTAWDQVPCGSLPDNDELIAVRIGMPLDMYMASKERLLRGWWKADDGRLYHHTMTERVLDMLEKRTKESRRKAEYRARMSGKRPGPSHDSPEMSHGTDAGQPQDSHGSDPGRDDTRTRTSTRTIKEEAAAAPPPRACAPAPAHEAAPPAAPPDPGEPDPSEPPGTIPDEAPARATQIAVLLRRNGADPRTVPNDRRIADWARDGVTDAEVLQALEAAKARRKTQGSDQPIGTAYLAPIIAQIRASPPDAAMGNKPRTRAERRAAWDEKMNAVIAAHTGQSPREIDMGTIDATDANR